MVCPIIRLSSNSHPAIWDNPSVFDPNRFADWSGSPFEFIPQGGGDYFLGHRCAGEQATMEIMKISLQYLNKISYEVPDNQNLSFSMVKIPSIPKSGIILRNINKKDRY
ncbi:cytochrome P450 [Oceanobacillus timonensis]|uniref:cytochrome P450 n=1 Tax=Oceanobacillus timonensis TaxID=1926285 RepID=UPI00118028EF|nr:cytochrome P450 [Oceanobacillus timonensis]